MNGSLPSQPEACAHGRAPSPFADAAPQRESQAKDKTELTSTKQGRRTLHQRVKNAIAAQPRDTPGALQGVWRDASGIGQGSPSA